MKTSGYETLKILEETTKRMNEQLETIGYGTTYFGAQMVQNCVRQQHYSVHIAGMLIVNNFHTFARSASSLFLALQVLWDQTQMQLLKGLQQNNGEFIVIRLGGFFR